MWCDKSTILIGRQIKEKLIFQVKSADYLDNLNLHTVFWRDFLLESTLHSQVNPRVNMYNFYSDQAKL